MGKILQFRKGGRLPLVYYDVLDVLRKTRIILVTEHGVVPACLNSKTVKLDIIFEDTVVFRHFQIINLIFGISGWVNQSKIGLESWDKFRPVM